MSVCTTPRGFSFFAFRILSLHSAAREVVQSAGISKKSSASSEDINSLHYLLTKKFIISKSVRVQDKTDQRENQPNTTFSDPLYIKAMMEMYHVDGSDSFRLSPVSPSLF